jgi:hypothetical protein
MQPYFLPYIGYFQLINYADIFVVYDDIQFTKKGWINRNSIPTKSGVFNFTIPCKASGEKSLVVEKSISPDFDRRKFLNRLLAELKNSINPTKNGEELLTRIIMYEESNLFRYIFHSITNIASYLNLGNDKLLISSTLGDFTHLRSQERVLAICKALNASKYINPISGSHLYRSDVFERENIELKMFEPQLPQIENQEKTLPFSIIHSIFNLSEENLRNTLSKGAVKNVT